MICGEPRRLDLSCFTNRLSARDVHSLGAKVTLGCLLLVASMTHTGSRPHSWVFLHWKGDTVSHSTHTRAPRTAAALGILSLLGGLALAPVVTSTAAVATPLKAATGSADNVDSEYADRFLELYNEIHDPANGYFSPQGIPYHAVETLIVEAPDHGHETTSEAYSFWIWLETSYGELTGDWEPLNHAWETMETYMIPQQADQPTNSFYNPNSPGTYAAEFNHPSNYPSALNSQVQAGKDPIGAELRTTYGNSNIYGMHWLADVDNTYGFGAAPGTGCQLGPTHQGTSYINTFQRGPQESVWETVPQPSCDDFTYGGKNGYLDLFTGDSSYSKQWKYTNAPDADARAIDAMYWANKWATEQGQDSQISATVDKASKMGDYLRYAMYDKYFKKIGCDSPSCPAGTGKDSSHYLMSWYYAWGGATDANSGWAWRIGSSHAHFGYQNPMAAWVLSNDSDLVPNSPTAAGDWQTSMDRQLEFYKWLQSSEGGIAGGASNSWDGAYAAKPAGTSTFYGMGYTEAPVYHDPPSNQWFGMQVWSMERIAQLYHASGDARAKALLDKWVPWALQNSNIVDGEDWSIPSELAWTGQPDTWNPTNPGANNNLHVNVVGQGQDIGVAGAFARTLIYYAAKSGDTVSQQAAKTLLDTVWENQRDDKGLSSVEARADYARFDDVYVPGGNGLYIPAGWTGNMPNGDQISAGKSFLDIRSFYLDDPDWPKVQAYLDGGPVPEFRYHRFWAQTAVATALADYNRFFVEDDGNTPSPTPTTTTPEPTPTSTTPTSTPTTTTPEPTPTSTTPTSTPTSTNPTSTDPTTTTPVPTPTTTGTSKCTATYRTTGSWPGGFQGELIVTANQPITAWSVGLNLGSATTNNLWGGVLSGTGPYTVTNQSWNGTLGTNGSATVGFIGNGNAPSSVTTSCN